MIVSIHDLLIMIGCALASGVGLTALGMLIEFALRKKHPAPLPEVGERPAAEPPAALPQSVPSLTAPLRRCRQRWKPANGGWTAGAAPPAVQPPASPTAALSAAVEEALEPPPQAAGRQCLLHPSHHAAGSRARRRSSWHHQRVLPPAPVGEAKPAVSRLRLGLRKTRDNFLGRLRAVVGGGAKTEEIYEGLEEALIGADVGVEASTKLVEAVRKKLKTNATADGIRDALKEEISAMLIKVERQPADSGDAPLVIMLVGVNGVGKTTTIAKLSARLKEERGPVIVAAADTFRAAAIEQLEIWCQRVGVEMIKQKAGSDPAAVAFDAVKAAKARKTPTVLIDTAGRLQTKVNLMEELKKIARVIGRELPGAPHETWLVLDANTGQNALSQAKIFADAVPLSGVVLAKLDSTAKGGVVVAIADRLKLPVRFVGVGEDIDDLRPFDGREFAEELFATDEGGAQGGKSYAA